MAEQSRKFFFAADTQKVIGGLSRAADGLVVALVGLIAFWVRHPGAEVPGYYLAALVAGVLLTVNYMHLARMYRPSALQRVMPQIGPLAATWTAVMLSLIALGYFTKTAITFSRIWVALWFSMSFAGFLLVRLLVAWQIARWRRTGQFGLNVAIVGAGEIGQQLVRYLIGQAIPGLKLVGVFDDRTTDIPKQVEGVPVRGTVDDLVRFVRDHAVDDIIIALPWRAKDEVRSTIKKLKVAPVNVRLCPEAMGFELPPRGFSSLAGLPMLNIYERPLSGWNLVVKAIEDRILSALILVLCLPLLVVIGILIKFTSPGPVLFLQKRYGFNNNEITVYKFRTMHHDPAGEARIAQATQHDPRVTRFGAFLRRTSLDELPQLVNVLKGEMSLVGPRPHAVPHNEQYAEIVDDYLSRHRVKPGITGWAQVNGLRGETETPEKMRRRVQHDLYYIDNWSLLFDLKILILTLFVGFVNKSAY